MRFSAAVTPKDGYSSCHPAFSQHGVSQRTGSFTVSGSQLRHVLDRLQAAESALAKIEGAPYVTA